jgi:hydrogenase maturation protein HypF
MAISYLYRTFKEKLPGLNLPLLQKYSDRIQPFITMIDRGINSPLTSSCGRLFDAVSSLARLRDVMTFEGQAPMELEMAIDEPHDLVYQYQVATQAAGPDFIISFEPMIAAIVEDVLQGRTASYISCCFHNTIAQVIADICGRISQQEGIKLVALSGGVFQNLYLLTRSVDLLRSKGFTVLTHEQVPTNDGGISLGQAVIARRAYKI